jgi:murein DD-endopeptidase MepM/ murein hydrolase activator NlpD
MGLRTGVMRFISRLVDRGKPAESYDVTIASVVGMRTIQFRVRRAALVVSVALVGVLLLIILAGAVTAGRQLREAARARALRAENAEFRRQLNRMGEMEGRIRALEETRKSLLTIMGAGRLAEATDEPDTAATTVQAGGLGPGFSSAIPDSSIAPEELARIKETLAQLPLHGPITRGFGLVAASGFFHTGVDIAGETGSKIIAPGDGVVAFAGFDDTYGNVLVISHDASLETMYGHNSKILVKVGDSISSGQLIARVGNTGQSSAPHLHFEVHWNGRAVDPMSIYQNTG